MMSLIVPVIVSAILTALMVPFIIHVSYSKRWFDTVDERTVHEGIVPRLGGSAFILSAVVAVIIGICMADAGTAHRMLTPESGPVQYCALVGAVLVIYLSGLWDDIRRIDYKKKFLCQLLSALLIVMVGGFWINDFYGLFGLGALSPLVGKTFTVLLIMYIINAFNLIDGIDGLASSLGVVASCVIGVISLQSDQFLMAVLSLALAASLAVFFCYNKFGSTRTRTKIFMGDGGSQTMGLIVAFLVVFVSMRKAGGAEPSLLQSPVISFCLIIIPCFDAVRVMVGRMMRSNNPFLPDKTHIHHKFLSIGYSDTQTLLAILLLDVVLVALNILLTVADIGIGAAIKINLILVLDLAIWCAVIGWLNKRLRLAKADNRQLSTH